MKGISFSFKGDFSHFENFANRITKGGYLDHILNRYGKEGVRKLSAATPRDTGNTADSWSYEIHHSKGTAEIIWSNDSVTDRGIPIILLLEYGHATRNGGFIQGLNMLSPIMQKEFKNIANEAWEEVTML